MVARSGWSSYGRDVYNDGGFMTLSLDALLETYRASAATERDKGTYYERLCAAFLTHDLNRAGFAGG